MGGVVANTGYCYTSTSQALVKDVFAAHVTSCSPQPVRDPHWELIHRSDLRATLQSDCFRISTRRDPSEGLATNARQYVTSAGVGKRQEAGREQKPGHNGSTQRLAKWFQSWWCPNHPKSCREEMKWPYFNDPRWYWPLCALTLFLVIVCVSRHVWAQLYYIII